MLDDLRRGFEVLLGKPLESFPQQARYVLWFSVDSELLPPNDRVPALTHDQLAIDRPPESAAKHDRETAEFWLRYPVDYAHTLFVYDKHDLGNAPHELVVALQSSHYALTGKELAALADAAKLDLAEVLRVCWYACRRAVTDGTLIDAMSAATLSTSAPHWLLSRAQYDAMADNIRFEPRWENALKPVVDPALREHLLMSCVDLRTSRWAGSWFDPKRKTDVWLEPVTRRGGEILAIWHSGEGQATRAVVKFEGAAIPIMMQLPADDSVAVTLPADEPAAEAKPKRKTTAKKRAVKPVAKRRR